MLVPNLARDPRPGYIAVGSFVPPGSPGQGPSARFANIVIRPDVVAFDVKAGPCEGSSGGWPPAPIEGIIRSWQVSRSFVAKEGGAPTIPVPDVLGDMRQLETEPTGLLELHRHVKVPAKGDATAVCPALCAGDTSRRVCARPGFQRYRDRVRERTPDLSRRRELFVRSSTTRWSDRIDQARLYLPLVAGENDLPSS